MKKNSEEKNAIELLESDHKNVKELFKKFEEEEDSEACKEIADQAIQELKVHTKVEEEIFYPAVEAAIDDEDGLLPEAHEEHHVAKTLIAELDKMSGDEDNYCAKFTVLAENVRHHIKEEENELFPEVKKSDLDLEALGRKMALRKEALQEGGAEAGAGARASDGKGRS